jgi:hypothetical protein
MENIIAAPDKVYSYSEFTEEVRKEAGTDERCKLNMSRINRLEKQIVLKDEFLKLKNRFDPRWKWLLIAEPWCGDGAQSIPVIMKIAELYPGISLEIILRDKNPEIMERYLTLGKKSIPKLICFNKRDGSELWIWGPRPSILAGKLEIIKKKNPEISKEELSKVIHLWYADNKSEAIQNEFLQIFREWEEK